jgi:hypothetical protein
VREVGDLEKWLAKRPRFLPVNLPPRRKRLRRRPRTPDKQRLFDLMIAARWRRWTEAGAIKQVGPRKYVIRLDRIPRL